MIPSDSRAARFLRGGFTAYLPPGAAVSLAVALAASVVPPASAHVHASGHGTHVAGRVSTRHGDRAEHGDPHRERHATRRDEDDSGRQHRHGRVVTARTEHGRTAIRMETSAEPRRREASMADDGPASRPVPVPASEPPRPDARVYRALMAASRATGVDPAFMFAVAARESRMDAGVSSTMSSATGLMQFTRVKWFETLMRYAGRHGMGSVADAIGKTPSGAMVVDRRARDYILRLRSNPLIAATMSAETFRTCRDAIEARTGRHAPPVDVYLSYVLGDSGWSQFESVLVRSPSVSTDRILPLAVDMNPGIFTRDGRSMSVFRARDELRRDLESDMRFYRTVMADAGDLDMTRRELADSDADAQDRVIVEAGVPEPDSPGMTA